MEAKLKISQHEMPPSPCPMCGAQMEGATGIGESGAGPFPGAWTICLYCGSILRFDDRLAVRLATADEVRALDEPSKKLLRIAKQCSQRYQAEKYEKQLQLMKARADEWRRLNPQREAKIQFNFRTDTAVICPISQAIAKHYVSVNDAGRELIAALWPEGGRDEPTILMIKAVLEP